MKATVVAVIPARLASSRLPRKMLAEIAGKPLIWHVYNRVIRAKKLSDVLVATDDEEIFRVVQDFGGKAVMTSGSHQTGTDRIAEVAAEIDADIIVNIQGDEIGIDPDSIDQLVESMLSASGNGIQVVNLIAQISNISDVLDTSVVKVVKDLNSNILYYTRLPIPYPRQRGFTDYFRQLGVYAFRRGFLLEFARMPQSPLELTEGIEFLRIIENGLTVRAVVSQQDSFDVDTEEDLVEARRRFAL